MTHTVEREREDEMAEDTNGEAGPVAGGYEPAGPAEVMTLRERKHVHPDEATLPAGLREPPVDEGLANARAALYEGVHGVLTALLSSMTPENMQQRLQHVNQLGGTLGQAAMELAVQPYPFHRARRRRKGMIGGVDMMAGNYGYDPVGLGLGNRETAGVNAIKEMVSAAAQKNRPTLEQRLDHLTMSMKTAKDAGNTTLYDKLAAQANTLADALAKQPVDPPTPGIEATGRVLGAEADRDEGYYAEKSYPYGAGGGMLGMPGMPGMPQIGTLPSGAPVYVDPETGGVFSDAGQMDDGDMDALDNGSPAALIAPSY